MEFEGDGIDSILHGLYQAIERYGEMHEGSRGMTRELLAVSIRIRKPRARISRSENRGKPFSALGELLWYLSGSNQLNFIEPYVSAYACEAVNGILEGAYGPRLTNMRDGIDQFTNIERLLSSKPGLRRAVIQIFNAEDIASEHKEIPCTTTLQFHLRHGALHLSVTMRSNDAYFGLPHDVFCFTMIQEMMARRLHAEVGEYYHYVGSMHVYEQHFGSIRDYVEEGIQQTVEMPPMPAGDPFPVVEKLLDIENRLRSETTVDIFSEMLDPYWTDIMLLLQVFWEREKWNPHYLRRLLELRAQLTHPMYRAYVDGRAHLKGRSPSVQITP